MSKWIDFTADERRAMIQAVCDERHIDEVSAEKDWWVTAVLCAMFRTSISKYLLFKGGTSLSKGWNIINRFSEDVDLAIDREYFRDIAKLQCANCTSNTQIHHLREKAQDYIFGELKDELQEVLNQIGIDARVLAENEAFASSGALAKVPHDKDPSVVFVQYPSLYASRAAYAVPVVKIEISVLSMNEPFEMRDITSLVGQKFESADADMACTVRTVSPIRTFLEKAFLLCEEYQKEEPRTHRMTRHFYDLEKLMQTPYAEMALNDADLIHRIVGHRRKFYHVGYVDYDMELPHSIQIVPPANLLSSYRSDYEEMRKSFIYGEALEFDALMGRIRALQEMFRKV